MQAVNIIAEAARTGWAPYADRSLQAPDAGSLPGSSSGDETSPQRAGVRQIAPGRLRLSVERETSYELHHTDRHAFDCADDTLARIVGMRPVFFVTDRVVDALYGEAIRRYGQQRLEVAGACICAGTEIAKTLRSVEEICAAAFEAGLRRDGVIVAIGGGVTLDMAGMAASIFRRGVAYVRVPTTLIGLVDVAVGVKQGVNAFGSKNLLGAFYPPLACVLDYSFLRTLPLAGFAAGFAEIVKMALIRDEHLLESVERHGSELIRSRFQMPVDAGRRIAERAEMLMMEELSENLFEEDLARRVDFGHTFSPVLEVESQHRISHGEAVALDMMLSTAIAINRELCDAALFSRLARLMMRLSLPLWHADMASAEKLAEAVACAKRHRGGSLNLVVPQRAGVATFLQQVSLEELEAARTNLWLAAKATTAEVPAAREMGCCASVSI